MAERYNIAEDSTVYFGMNSTSSSSWQTGVDSDVRSQFLLGGTLNKTQDTDFRAINNRSVVFAHAVDFGNITTSSVPAVWSLGLVRDPVITYSVGNARNRSPYFRTQFDQIEDAAKFFITDYGDAVKRANAIDAKIMTDASVVSSQYADLIAIGTRQTMAGVDITVAYGADGKWNMSDVKAFMRDTGPSQSISRVEMLFSAFPAFLYLNSSLGGLLLDPLLDLQSSSDDRLFSAPDLGLYPQATGHQAYASNTAVESTGSMLIMALAHAQASGDGTLLAHYYELLKGWTEYLSTSSLHTENQLFFDGQEISNQSNLAIKGIIGIAAMARISHALNQESDSQTYFARASDLSAQWTSLAARWGHVTSVYGEPQSSPLVYNLYADILLRTNVVDSSIYSQQTDLYEILSATAPNFGIPYDGSTQETRDVTSAPWTIFTAATAIQNTTRDKLIDMVHSKATTNDTRGDFPTTYRGSSGEAHLNDGQASPAQGGMFAILALNLPVQNVVAPPVPADERIISKLNVGLIAGIVIASLAGIALLAIILSCLRRRRLRNSLHQDRADRQRAPDFIFTSQGAISYNVRSDYAAHGSEQPQLSDMIAPNTQLPSESAAPSYWSSRLPYLARRAPSSSASFPY